MNSPPLSRRCRQQHGFTLIELMITVVVIAVIAAIAFPSYLGSIRKSRRSEAFAALSAVQQAQERWRGNNGVYANNGQLTLPPFPAVPSGLGLSSATPSGYYTIVISGDSATGYTVTAGAQGSQANDLTCRQIAVQMNNGNLSYGSGTPVVDWTDAARCWAK